MTPDQHGGKEKFDFVLIKNNMKLCMAEFDSVIFFAEISLKTLEKWEDIRFSRLEMEMHNLQ